MSAEIKYLILFPRTILYILYSKINLIIGRLDNQDNASEQQCYTPLRVTVLDDHGHGELDRRS